MTNERLHEILAEAVGHFDERAECFKGYGDEPYWRQLAADARALMSAPEPAAPQKCWLCGDNDGSQPCQYGYDTDKGCIRVQRCAVNRQAEPEAPDFRALLTEAWKAADGNDNDYVLGSDLNERIKRALNQQADPKAECSHEWMEIAGKRGFYKPSWFCPKCQLSQPERPAHLNRPAEPK